MSASGNLFLQERHIQAQQENNNQKLITWKRLTSIKRLRKSTKEKRH
jgi:hypothetical protein